MVKRVCGKQGDLTEKAGKQAFLRRFHITKKEVIAAFVCCVVDFGIAQFGLLNLIQKAYSGIAYLAIPVILIPYIVHMIVTRFDTKELGEKKSQKGPSVKEAEVQL